MDKLEAVFRSIQEIEGLDIEIDIGGDELLTIILYSKEEFAEGQLGYRQDHLGESFIGEADGDWKDNWYVIGYEELLGDPIFIDVNDEHIPVYTAMHGEGDWEPEVLFPSLKAFINSVKEQE